MENLSQKVWPPLVPKILQVEKPVSEYLREWAEFSPDRIALRFYGRDISYAELNESIDRFAQGLLALGLEKGDRVALFMQNCPQFVITYFGILRAGGVVVCLNPMFKQAELEYEISDAGSEILISLDSLYPEVEKIESQIQLKHVILTSLKDYMPSDPILPFPKDSLEREMTYKGAISFLDFIQNAPATPTNNITNLDDLALLQYTGGTMGLPKGAMLTHYNLSYACVGTVHWYRHRYDDVHLGVTPFFHIMGMQQLMCTPLISGGQIVVLTRFDAEVTARAIELYRCTYWVTATTSLIAFLETPGIERYDFGSLRCLWSGGTPISVEIQVKIKDLAPNAIIGEGYGLTECVSQGGAITPLLRYKPGFVGIPQLSQMKIVDLENGEKELAPGEEGEIVIKGPTVCAGYWNRPEETQLTFRNGWLYTGDIGMLDEEGYLKIVGRKKELIKCSGYSVFPSEVENLLFKLPAVADVAVVGVQDPYRGESPKAYIILKAEYKNKIDEKDVIAWCKENMATYKRPREVEFRDDLPRSAAGKILRRVLLEESKKI
ncbi:AMP-binding protein [Desulfatiglans anilini]|uniref:AMP-binding protein n=1 Tax=Desulfatiglans anilini TaxID=90728 RepID=UPI0004132B5C|nr:AMP-binding protein [Desulfatiglans anilini]